MVFQVYVPAFPLSHFIKHLIYFEGTEPIHNIERFLPDGNSEFLVELTENSQAIYENETLAELQICRHGWVSGVRTRPITIPSGRGTKKLIVAFQQGKGFPFIKIPMSELADKVVDADIIFGARFRQFREQLLASPSWQQTFQLTENFLLQLAGEELSVDTPAKCVAFAVSNIAVQPNILVFQQFTRQIGYSQKHFIDLFKRHVGITPKKYLNIMRFQMALLEIEHNQAIDWRRVALDSGYYDQAHFIRDFKRFSGFTPNEYVSKKTETLNYIPVG